MEISEKISQLNNGNFDKLKNSLDLNKITKALKVNRKQRSLKDQVAICEFLRNHKLFYSGEDLITYQKVIMSLASSAFFAQCKKNRFVFQEGSHGELFYIIISGKVGLVFGQESSDTTELEEEILARMDHKIEGSSGGDLQFTSPEGTASPQESPSKEKAVVSFTLSFNVEDLLQSGDNNAEEKEVKTALTAHLGEGECFGEMAMFALDSKRSCGVKALEDCCFAVIHRDAYQKMLSNFISFSERSPPQN